MAHSVDRRLLITHLVVGMCAAQWSIWR